MEYTIGQKASLTRQITDADILSFAQLTEDKNPVHCDEEYAQKTIFKGRIAHGIYVASFISAVLANQLPGPGSIYLSQTLKFEKPVYMGDIITAEVEIEAIRSDKMIITLGTRCFNQKGIVVLSGTAVTKVL